jgi:hypothetical protein
MNQAINKPIQIKIPCIIKYIFVLILVNKSSSKYVMLQIKWRKLQKGNSLCISRIAVFGFSEKERKENEKSGRKPLFYTFTSRSCWGSLYIDLPTPSPFVTEEPVCTCCFCLSLHRHASSWPPMTNLPERFNNSETLLLSEGSGGTRRWAFQGQGWYQCSLFINSKGISLWLAAKSGG